MNKASLVAPECPLTKKTSCHLCGRWAGWFDYPDTRLNALMWGKYQKEQQQEHQQRWLNEIDSMKLVEKTE